MNSELFNKTSNIFDIFGESRDVIVALFSSDGNICKSNNAVKSILSYSDEDIKTLKINNIFDFRVIEIDKLTANSSEKTIEINVIDKERNFIPTKTSFIKSEDNILTITYPISISSEEQKLSEKLIKTMSLVKEVLLKESDLEENVFGFVLENIKSLISYNKGFVMLLEGDSLIIRECSDYKHCKTFRKTLTENDKALGAIIKNHKSIIENKNFEIIEELGLKVSKPSSTIVSPLSIRNMVYGLIILINEDKKFKKEDIEILESMAAVSSYIIKDVELSQVFKMQLNVLKDNIKERTKTLELIKEQNKKILEADRIKNEFLANMSHELRTPLNAVIGFSEALELKIFGDLNEKQTEYVSDIKSSGVHLLGMINDLLDLSKIESGKMSLNKEEFDAVLAASEAMNIVAPLADKKNISLKTEFKAGNIVIRADRRKFQQILYNLLSNAIKFTDHQGEVSLLLKKNKKNLQISVRDNGIGIPEEHHEKIFSKFHQVDSSLCRKQGSTGLGLTITKELLEMHGGKIYLDSQPGQGATFTFTMPVSQ